MNQVPQIPLEIYDEIIKSLPFRDQLRIKTELTKDLTGYYGTPELQKEIKLRKEVARIVKDSLDRARAENMFPSFVSSSAFRLVPDQGLYDMFGRPDMEFTDQVLLGKQIQLYALIFGLNRGKDIVLDQDLAEAFNLEPGTILTPTEVEKQIRQHTKTVSNPLNGEEKASLRLATNYYRYLFSSLQLLEQQLTNQADKELFRKILQEAILTPPLK